MLLTAVSCGAVPAHMDYSYAVHGLITFTRTPHQTRRSATLAAASPHAL